MKKRELFKVEGNKIIRLRRNCPKCGEGVFLAEHKDRLSCGRCGYTEFKSKKHTTNNQKTQEKTVTEQKPNNQTAGSTPEKN
ncbi:MAG: 30S ribosomal protein S27ae [Thermoplasmata archaeon]|nr:MAG: 30S ribosomal protein S27ae [Thermoplasmata archaeon]